MRLTGIGGTAGQIEALEIIDPEGDIGVVDAELALMSFQIGGIRRGSRRERLEQASTSI